VAEPEPEEVVDDLMDPDAKGKQLLLDAVSKAAAYLAKIDQDKSDRFDAKMNMKATATASKTAFEKQSKSKEAMNKAVKEVADMEAAIAKAEKEEPEIEAAKEAALTAKTPRRRNST